MSLALLEHSMTTRRPQQHAATAAQDTFAEAVQQIVLYALQAPTMMMIAPRPHVRHAQQVSVVLEAPRQGLRVRLEAMMRIAMLQRPVLHAPRAPTVLVGLPGSCCARLDSMTTTKTPRHPAKSVVLENIVRGGLQLWFSVPQGIMMQMRVLRRIAKPVLLEISAPAELRHYWPVGQEPMTMTTPRRLLAFLAILGHIVQEGLLQVFHVLREHGMMINRPAQHALDVNRDLTVQVAQTRRQCVLQVAMTVIVIQRRDVRHAPWAHSVRLVRLLRLPVKLGLGIMT